MKIMIGVGHPKHVHFWKNIVKKLENNGHEVKIIALTKTVINKMYIVVFFRKIPDFSKPFSLSFKSFII